MTRWKRNESVAAQRRVQIAAYDSDGALADPRHTFTGTNEKLVDPSTGSFVAPAGTLSNAREPLVVPDFVYTTTHGSDQINKVAHGIRSGSGPFRTSNVGGALPNGFLVATDYWWIWRSADTGQFASSLANALLGIAVPITDNGTGVHTISDVAGTQQLVDGHWIYEATQAETDIDGSYFAIKIKHDASTGAATDAADTAGVTTLTGTGFLSRHVGRRITVAGFVNAGNNGEFTITAVAIDGLTCTYANPDGVDETHAATYTIDDAVRVQTVSVDLFVPSHDRIAVGAYTHANVELFMWAVLLGLVTDYEGDEYEFKDPATEVVRVRGTVNDHGRQVIDLVDGSP